MESMSNRNVKKLKIHISDDILYNILTRLPGKSLLRFRCVSKHWNTLISDPYFMNSRSRRMILLPFPRPLVVLDDNIPLNYDTKIYQRCGPFLPKRKKDKTHCMVGVHSPLEEYQEQGTTIRVVSIVGSFNGIVLLALTDNSYRCHLVLYNPLTRFSTKLVVLDPPPSYDHVMIPYVFGFGYGATTGELKIVRFKVFNRLERALYQYECDVYALRTGSWSRPPGELIRAFFFLGNNAGLFLNGFLYWVTSDETLVYTVLELNVEKMIFSKIKLPDGHDSFLGPLLGSIDGCLCMVNRIGCDARFGLWVMKEQGEWLKTHSFSIKNGRPVCIMGNGKILFVGMSMLLFMYDLSKDSCTRLYDLVDNVEFKKSGSVYCLKDKHSIEYVESLVSPSDICYVCFN
ncbi:putative F-box domain-containing protein [Helianthus annuus]|nr:putative F-box domain-containing protein [Helianthus annuus]